MSNLLEVKVKSGTFFLSSKEDKGEGWEKQEFKNPQNKDETLIRYHKKLSIKGKVTYLAMAEDKFKGKVLSLIVKGEEDYSLKVPILDNDGKVKTTNSYFNSLVGPLENVKKGDEITMFVNNKNKDKNDNLYRNIVVLDSEGKLIKSNFSFSDVPKWKKNEIVNDFGETDVEWDASESKKFYIDKFNSVLESFSSEKETKEPSNNTIPSTSKEPEETDLPF